MSYVLFVISSIHCHYCRQLWGKDKDGRQERQTDLAKLDLDKELKSMGFDKVDGRDVTPTPVFDKDGKAVIDPATGKQKLQKYEAPSYVKKALTSGGIPALVLVNMNDTDKAIQFPINRLSTGWETCYPDLKKWIVEVISSGKLNAEVKSSNNVVNNKNDNNSVAAPAPHNNKPATRGPRVERPSRVASVAGMASREVPKVERPSRVPRTVETVSQVVETPKPITRPQESVQVAAPAVTSSKPATVPGKIRFIAANDAE